MTKEVKIVLFIAIIMLVVGSGVVLWPRNTVNNEQYINNQPTNINTNTEIVPSTEWVIYNANKEGVKEDILGNFEFPSNWFTYNFAGGQTVAIYFSDGGVLVNSHLNKNEITSSLAQTEIDEGENRQDECKISITYFGDKQLYNIKEYNTKINMEQKEDCERILSILHKQSVENSDNGQQVDISDWQTYRNEEYGFELIYPNSWDIDKKTEFSKIAKFTSPNFASENNEILKGAIVEILIQENWQKFKFDNLDENLDYQFALPFKSKNIISSNYGINFYKLLFEDNSFIGKNIVNKQSLLIGLISNDRFILSIRFSAVETEDNEFYNIYDQIIKSIKF